ncbi:SsrA-binding protein SmpB [Sphaerobacter sp.]|uniref:SsrA-binding protein SmpB n=1 Tax=Sphaerobacter sp. TaxID=2099654 RepID=UPI001D2C2033|nr:SsrA-binding protein SmpB [Sphaerobacter sp.]MBX5443550.1 SsrA-binding protein SmpB [Sphaerobacter sp.]
MAKAKAPAASGGEKVVATNRKAYHDYHIEEELEAGIALTGTEIKSIRAGRVNLRDAYARIENGELWLIGMHISPYEHAGGYFQHDPDRPRKLLVHRNELNYLRNRVEAKGYTLVPLRLVLRKGLAKVDIGVARGKKTYDKREAMAERDARREMERALRQR